MKMTSFQRFPLKSIRLTALMCCVALLLIGCSGSSSDNNNTDQLDGESATDNNANSENNENNGDETSDAATGTEETGPIDLQPVQVELEILADKTFRISWQITPNATLYRVLENPDGASGFTNISGDLDASTSSFDHRVALFARVNAQYLVQSCNDQGCVNSNTVLANVSLDNAITYFKSGNPENASSQSDEFGVSVSLSADGNTMAVGAPSDGTGALEQADAMAEGAGDVYVFVRNDSLWQQQAFLNASNTEDPDRFGFSVSLSADGNTLAVGAPGEASAAMGINADQNDNSAPLSGAAYTFVRTAETWQQQAYIKASNTDELARFGWNVSLSSDGNTLAVGARNEASLLRRNDSATDSSDFYGRGAVYVFTQNNELWQQETFIKAGTQAGNDFFGEALSLSANGNTLAVGNVGDDSAATGINGDPIDSSAEQSGAAYVYVRGGGTWQQQAYIKASNTGAADEFGISLSLSDDGNTLAIGAPSEDSVASGIDGEQTSNTAVESGATYVFVRQGTAWQQQAYIKASNASVSDGFGEAVALSADSNTLVVSAVGEDSTSTGLSGDQLDGSASNAGAAYVFVRSGGLWQQTAYIKASNTGTQDQFGNALSLSEDGSTLAVGTRHEDSAATGVNASNNANANAGQSDNSVQDAGAVYLY